MGQTEERKQGRESGDAPRTGEERQDVAVEPNSSFDLKPSVLPLDPPLRTELARVLTEDPLALVRRGDGDEENLTLLDFDGGDGFGRVDSGRDGSREWDVVVAAGMTNGSNDGSFETKDLAL